MTEYAKNPAPSTQMEMNLAYFNSTSSEYIFRLCKHLEQIQDAGSNCRLIWEYESEDEDMRQIGEDYAEILKLNFELKAMN
jgi:hypothetical protein